MAPPPIPTSLPAAASAPFVDQRGILTQWALRFLAPFVQQVGIQVPAAQDTADTAIANAATAQSAAEAAQTTATAAETAAAAAQTTADTAIAEVVAETARAEAAEALLAPKASPVFSGSPPIFGLFPSFANDAAAAAGGIVVGQIYWSSTVNAVVQRRV